MTTVPVRRYNACYSFTQGYPALDLVKMPLFGSHLIEASAGTGKTWTLAALYLRLVLGHGDENTAYSRALAPAEILVLTFTRAATRELSERIRARLAQAAAVFRAPADPANAGADAYLIQLLDDYPEGLPRRQAAWRLEQAAQTMDAAAIHTIDAWCQRTLREHVLDSHGALNPELLTDEVMLRQEAVQDYWRQQLYTLSGAALDTALSVWPSLENLQTDVRNFLRFKKDLPPFENFKISLAELLKKQEQDQNRALQNIKLDWLPRASKMVAWLQQQFDQNEVPFDKKKFNASNAIKWSQALVDWVQNSNQVEPALSETAWSRLQPSGLQAVFKSGHSVCIPEFFNHTENLIQDLAQIKNLKSTLRLHAAVQVAQRMAELKKQTNSCGFDDFQNQLHNALHGPHAKHLCASLLAQYPVALVDEFQDTSQPQAQIFNAIYRLADNDSRFAVFLIGDPKQSIYAFRGADIHSYLQARQATQGRHHMLATNHRASVNLVGAVNQLFHLPQGRPGSGTFLFRSAAQDPVPFIPVVAQGRPEQLQTSTGVVPAITWCFDDEPCTKVQSLPRLAMRCAQRMATWLGSNHAYFQTDAIGVRVPLCPADIAVLVRDRTEARVIQNALQAVGLPSVYLSDQHSVFSSAQAADLVRWLQAVAQPNHARLLRAALATTTMAFSLDELKVLARSEDTFERHCEHFIELNQVWARQGVLAMLRRALHVLNLPSRWLNRPGGERCLTNVLHLAELLQAASEKLQSHNALIEWLMVQTHPDTLTQTEQLQRLESDADLVKVVTVHKSKGLEYPVVFLPFASVTPRQTKNTSLTVSRDEKNQRQLQLHMTPAVLAQTELERMQEDLRLLYVAFTRARHAVWAGVSLPQNRQTKSDAQANDFHLTALGYLLSGPASVPSDQVKTALLDLCKASSGTSCEMLTELEPHSTRVPPSLKPPLVSPAPYQSRFDVSWRIGSFSALVRHMAPNPTLSWPGRVREDELLEMSTDMTPVTPSTLPWHTFPKGAMVGNFLHHQLEWLAQEGFALDTSEALQQQLLRRCEREGFGHLGEQLVVWLKLVVSQTLPLMGSSLSNLTTHLPEMEFWLPSVAVSAAKIDALCAQHWLPHLPCSPLPKRELNGMLMGFADLVFECQGRYWVLDYKSNYLGGHNHHYHPSALVGACAQHRYDVQAALYLLALHRLLKARLGVAYQPEQHLGGAICYFVRGIQTEHRGCHYFPASVALLEALDVLV
jgi:exodeoxyribonuclease V beta subunit